MSSHGSDEGILTGKGIPPLTDGDQGGAPGTINVVRRKSTPFFVRVSVGKKPAAKVPGTARVEVVTRCRPSFIKAGVQPLADEEQSGSSDSGSDNTSERSAFGVTTVVGESHSSGISPTVIEKAAGPKLTATSGRRKKGRSAKRRAIVKGSFK